MFSQQCKFELKANVDRVHREKGISRTQAVAEVAAELDLHVETARTQDKRARRELGQIEPKKSKTNTNRQSSADTVIQAVTKQIDKIMQKITEHVESGHQIKLEVFQALMRSFEDLQDVMLKLENGF